MNQRTKKEMIYLACAYSPVYFGYTLSGFFTSILGRIIQAYRFRRISKVAATLIKQGHNVFSPISHSHPIPLDKLDSNLWLSLDYWFLSRVDIIYVLDKGNWQKSHGVWTELAWGKKLEIPIYLIGIDGKIIKRLY